MWTGAREWRLEAGLLGYIILKTAIHLRRTTNFEKLTNISLFVFDKNFEILKIVLPIFKQ
jgi:hypothetical protein